MLLMSSLNFWEASFFVISCKKNLPRCLIIIMAQSFHQATFPLLLMMQAYEVKSSFNLEKGLRRRVTCKIVLKSPIMRFGNSPHSTDNPFGRGVQNDDEWGILYDQGGKTKRAVHFVNIKRGGHDRKVIRLEPMKLEDLPLVKTTGETILTMVQHCNRSVCMLKITKYLLNGIIN